MVRVSSGLPDGDGALWPSVDTGSREATIPCTLRLEHGERACAWTPIHFL